MVRRSFEQGVGLVGEWEDASESKDGFFIFGLRQEDGSVRACGFGGRAAGKTASLADLLESPPAGSIDDHIDRVTISVA